MEQESIEAKLKLVKSIMGSEISEPDVVKALSQCNNNADAALNLILDSPSPHFTVKKTLTSNGGSRISAFQVNPPGNLDDDSVAGRDEKMKDCSSVGNGKVEKGSVLDKGNTESDLCFPKRDGFGKEKNGGIKEPSLPRVKEEPCEGSESKSVVLVEEKGIQSGEKFAGSEAKSGSTYQKWLSLRKCEKEGINCGLKVKQEPNVGSDSKSLEKEGINCEVKVKEEPYEGCESKSLVLVEKVEPLSGEKSRFLERNGSSSVEDEKKPVINGESKVEIRVEAHPYERKENKSEIITIEDDCQELFNVHPLSSRKLSDAEYRRLQMQTSQQKSKKKVEEEMRLSTLVIEDGDFLEDPDWLLVGRTLITGLSTTKGRKLENNEIVHFTFPQTGKLSSSSRFTSAKAANANSSIVRFSTKRSGEIGRLPMEWAKCLVPLVNSSKVKVCGRCVAAPIDLHLMQELMLYVSFYIHHSIFTGGDMSSWKLEPMNIDTTTYPLLTLFKLLKVIPSQKAEFTPEELDSRKRSLKLSDDLNAIGADVVPLTKKRKGCQLQEQDKDEQCISESHLNKLVGAAEVYNLQEMEPPETLTCDLRPYQKQALYWMSELETGAHIEEAGKTLHPCWAAYRICDERALAIYVNIFSGEATTRFPTATQAARGGILADAMGLGKTVMTIALILARIGKGSPNDSKMVIEDEEKREYIKNKRRDSTAKPLEKVKGGTLIVCPMALLSQWKDELETHSKPDSISIFVHYGGDRSNDPKAIAEPDVVLTTYGVLSAAYKKDPANSIFHRVEWHRVVLDEAHTIKSSKSQGAQAAFALSSYCRWCLTGTPLQNNLEDLYSLLCFLHVEPWCNWAWWSKLIQRPYENGDNRGLKLVKAILRPLMLRRTKESKDNEGRPILVLPPTDIKVIECEQSEEERDFYDALFKRSKVQFDNFVAQGKVLHNYANILELLLRLRQCCNHPFLVMSRGDIDKYADLEKLTKRFLEANPGSSTQTGPSRAYVEEVVEGLRNGENSECPICLESADDPVLTPCAHRMCRECLLSSWRTPVHGLCPICRQMINKSELITCPSGGRFRVDVEKNWKESSKITKLLNCLDMIRSSGTGEKSIIFSQWTSFLDLLEIPFKRRDIGFLRFDGRLAQKKRADVLHEFAETKDKMVLLMSLKAGGVGLNLTAASNVFLMDPWWNPAVEEQAIMRIHRIGQKRTVRVRRFIVKDTVEERLQQVQARKQRMVAGALTDEEVRSARLEELKMLFR